MLLIILFVALSYAQECSADIKHVQEMLIELSYSCGPSVNDGCKGADTTAAIKQFQSDYGLEVDGNAGPITTSTLESLTNNGNGLYSDENVHIQQMLIQLGYSCGVYGDNGYYGPQTITSVAQFQRDYGLTVDGIAGPQTVAKLEELTDGGDNGNTGGSPDITPVGGSVTSANAESSPHQPCDSQNRCYEEVYYNQCDGRWGSDMYSSDGNAGCTICNSGCGPTAMAMVAATYVDRSITPVETCDYAARNGLVSDNDGTYWAFFPAYASYIGLSCEQLDCWNMDYVRNRINSGALGVALMGPGQWTSGGHYIAINSFDGDYIFAHDPAYYPGKSSSQEISQFINECKQIWLFNK